MMPSYFSFYIVIFHPRTRSLVSGVADVRVKDPRMTDLKYGCDLYSGKYGNSFSIICAELYLFQERVAN